VTIDLQSDMKNWACLLAAPLYCCVFLLLSGCGTSPSNSNSGQSATPLVVSSISPTAVTAGSGALALTVNGSGFTSSTAVQVNGVVETTTYVGSTQLTATIPASQLVSGGSLAVVAVDGSASSATGTPIGLTVNNALPTVTQLIPAALVAGSPSTPVSLVGTGFTPATAVQVNGTARSASYTSATQATIMGSTPAPKRNPARSVPGTRARPQCTPPAKARINAA